VHEVSYLRDGVIVQVELAELRHTCCNMGSDVGLLLLLLLLLGFAGAVCCACARCSPMLIQLLPVQLLLCQGNAGYIPVQGSYLYRCRQQRCQGGDGAAWYLNTTVLNADADMCCV